MSSQVVFIFVPVEATGEGFAERLHECIASIEPKPEPATNEAVRAEAEKDQPLWTWFMPNPRPVR
jgi:hypothetical protein